MRDQWRFDLLGTWAHVITDRPRIIVTAGVVLAILCTVLAATKLRFEPDRNALISEDLVWNQRYIRYVEQFAGSDMYVVVEVPEGPGGMAQAERFVDALVPELRRSERIGLVFAGFAPDAVSPAAIRLLDGVQFEQAVDELREAKPLAGSPTVAALLRTAVQQGLIAPGGAAGAGPTAQEAEALAALSGAIRVGLAAPAGAAADPWQALRAQQSGGYQYLVTDDRALLLVSVTPEIQMGEGSELDVYGPVLADVRRAIAAASQAVPGVNAGATGVDAVEADETAITNRDATLASILSVVVIAALLVVAFHSWQLPLLAVMSLLLGVAWTFGFVTLAIGHLQILSVVFTVILLGLGIDFGIHVMSQFELLRPQHPAGVAGFRETMRQTIQTVGPGIITGALTTAAAFSTTVLTDFDGVGEMGLIAAAGLLLCLVAMLGVFPAMMRLARARRGHIVPLHRRRVSFYQHHWYDALSRRPRVTLMIGGVLLALLALGMPRLRYNDSLFALLPDGIDSVQWQEKLLAHSGESIWLGVSMVDSLEEAGRLTERYRAIEGVASVQGAARLFPLGDEAKLAALAEAREELLESPPASGEDDAPPATMTVAALQQTVGGLAQLLGLAAMVPASGDESIRVTLAAARAELLAASRAVAQLEPDEAQRRVDRLQKQYAAFRADVIEMIREATAQRPLRLTDLPEVLKHQIVSRTGTGTMIVEVYPEADVSNPRARARFVASLMEVDPEVTGSVVQFELSSHLIRRAYLLAGGYAIAAVFVLCMVDFRRFKPTVLALLPVLAAFVALFGVMGWFGIELNPANIIVLPMLFGMGVDAGVHMVHRHQQSPTERPPGLTGGTGKGITLTTITTAIGFASLLIAHHRGIRSLGLTLTLGIALTLAVSLTIMPSVLEVLRRRTGDCAAGGDAR